MHWLDTTILILLAFGFAMGFWSGLLWQVARVLGLGLAVYATLVLNEPVRTLLQDQYFNGADPIFCQGLAYVLVFLGVYLFIFVAARLLHGTIKAANLEFADRLLGAMLGMAKVAAAVAAACTGMARLEMPMAQELHQQSKLAPAFAKSADAFVTLLPPESRQQWLDRGRDYWQDLQEKLAYKAAEPQE